MTSSNMLSQALQALPSPLRRTLYSLLLLLGAVLAVCSALGVDDLGPVSLTQALQVYAVLSAATGGVAVANVSTPTTDGYELADLHEDVDLSSFEPVGNVEDVFGPTPA